MTAVLDILTALSEGAVGVFDVFGGLFGALGEVIAGSSA